MSREDLAAGDLEGASPLCALGTFMVEWLWVGAARRMILGGPRICVERQER